MDGKEIKNIADPGEYDYELPEDRIAKYPVTDRAKSNLLIYKDGQTSSGVFSDIVRLLPKDGLLILNDTKVIQARLLFRKTTGASIEIFCLEPHNPSDYALSLSSLESCEWKCLVGNSKRWKGSELKKNIAGIELSALLIHHKNGSSIVRFSWNNPSISFGEILEKAGEVPLPPYIRRATEKEDKVRYQTVYARSEGSVAAPTAGLHFTEEVLMQVRSRGIPTERLCLHVGAGTFKPVQANDIEDHIMHTEHFFVSRALIEKIYLHKGPIIAVGTTTVRTIESLYQLGCYCHIHSNIPFSDPAITQWIWKEMPDLTRTDSMKALLNQMDKNKMENLETSTQIMIIPGYHFRMTDVLVTNFHQPRSTLLMLIAAFIGSHWKELYQYALVNDFRFLSFGDGSLLFKD